MAEIRDDEPDIHVCRSALDPDVWFCLDFGESHDMHAWEYPGRVQAVKRWAAKEFSEGRPVRWERIDDNSWRMRIRRPRARKPEGD